MDNFDPYNVLLVIATNILMTAFVLHGHIYGPKIYWEVWKFESGKVWYFEMENFCFWPNCLFKDIKTTLLYRLYADESVAVFGGCAVQI